MALHPKRPADLELAPVAAAIDLNLQPLRDRTPAEIEAELALSLNLPTNGTVDDRARWVCEAATRLVDLHHWRAQVTDDHARLRLEGGSVQLDVGLSASLREYIEHGVSR